MFPKVKECIQTNKKGLLGYEFFEYLDELQNSKVFKHSNINIIDNPTPQINGSTKFASNLKIDDGFRFFGDIYLYSIDMTLIPNGLPQIAISYSGSFIIRGIFNVNQQSGFTSDPQKVKEIDRLDKLDQLYI